MEIHPINFIIHIWMFRQLDYNAPIRQGFYSPSRRFKESVSAYCLHKARTEDIEPTQFLNGVRFVFISTWNTTVIAGPSELSSKNRIKIDLQGKDLLKEFLILARVLCGNKIIIEQQKQ